MISIWPWSRAGHRPGTARPDDKRLDAAGLGSTFTEVMAARWTCTYRIRASLVKVWILHKISSLTGADADTSHRESNCERARAGIDDYN